MKNTTNGRDQMKTEPEDKEVGEQSVKGTSKKKSRIANFLKQIETINSKMGKNHQGSLVNHTTSMNSNSGLLSSNTAGRFAITPTINKSTSIIQFNKLINNRSQRNMEVSKGKNQVPLLNKIEELDKESKGAVTMDKIDVESAVVDKPYWTLTPKNTKTRYKKRSVIDQKEDLSLDKKIFRSSLMDFERKEQDIKLSNPLKPTSPRDDSPRKQLDYFRKNIQKQQTEYMNKKLRYQSKEDRISSNGSSSSPSKLSKNAYFKINSDRKFKVVNNFNLSIGRGMEACGEDQNDVSFDNLLVTINLKDLEINSLRKKVSSLNQTITDLEKENMDMRQKTEDLVFSIEQKSEQFEYYKKMYELKTKEVANISNQLSYCKSYIQAIHSNNKQAVEADNSFSKGSFLGGKELQHVLADVQGVVSSNVPIDTALIRGMVERFVDSLCKDRDTKESVLTDGSVLEYNKHLMSILRMKAHEMMGVNEKYTAAIERYNKLVYRLEDYRYRCKIYEDRYYHMKMMVDRTTHSIDNDISYDDDNKMMAENYVGEFELGLIQRDNTCDDNLLYR